MNHYEKVAHEKMLQEQQRQQTASDEADDPWCRTLLPREGDKGKKVFPEPADYYRGPKGAEAAALVVELYQVDFELYKYSTADPTGIGLMSLQETLQRMVKGGRGGQQPALVVA